MKRYRIVRDNLLYYKVQVWRLWFPFWIDVPAAFFFSLNSAEDFIRTYATPFVKYVKP